MCLLASCYEGTHSRLWFILKECNELTDHIFTADHLLAIITIQNQFACELRRKKAITDDLFNAYYGEDIGGRDHNNEKEYIQSVQAFIVKTDFIKSKVVFDIISSWSLKSSESLVDTTALNQFLVINNIKIGPANINE